LFHANVELKLFCEICNFEDFLLLPNMKIYHIDRDHRQKLSGWMLVLSDRIQRPEHSLDSIGAEVSEKKISKSNCV
jgi:hypothetical protein